MRLQLQNVSKLDSHDGKVTFLTYNTFVPLLEGPTKLPCTLSPGAPTIPFLKIIQLATFIPDSELHITLLNLFFERVMNLDVSPSRDHPPHCTVTTVRARGQNILLDLSTLMPSVADSTHVSAYWPSTSHLEYRL